MFTGLIEKLGTIQAIEEKAGYRLLTLALNDAAGYAEQLGESIAINGCCLTVTHRDAQSLRFDISFETLAKTNLGDLKAGSLVNLERALRVGDRLGGHMVAGHVDSVGMIRQVDRLEGGWNVWIELPLALARYVIPKGSITLDGISLTVNELKDHANYSLIRLTLIPATIENTNVQIWQAGATVNVEVDMVGKYLERMALPHLQNLGN
jgi:riboflavin synthase